MNNAVFDLNNLFFRSLFIVGGFGSKGFTFDTQAETDKLIRKVSTDISYIIRQINPSRIIFTLDSTSWRKNIEIEENEGYKAHRKKSKHINWDNVFAKMKEFSEILEGNGFIVSKINKAEADDLIALWANELLYNQKQHVIIISSDEDIRQLVKSYPLENDKQVFSVVFNPFTQGRNGKKKLFIPKNFNKWLNESEEADIFNRSIDIDKEDFIRLRDIEKIVFEEIDNIELSLRKIFCGDDGDNVPAIYSWTNDNEKNVRITPSYYRKIIKNTGIDHYDELLDKADLIKEQLELISGKKSSLRINQRLQRQLKLVVLDSKFFPKEIVEEFSNTVDEKLSSMLAHPQKWNMNSILEGTRYVKNKGDKNPDAEASIFKDIDQLNKKLF